MALLSWEIPETSARGFVEFDAILLEEYTRAAEVSTFTVETGVQYSDHVQPQPRAITLEVFVSDTPTTALLAVGEEGQRAAGAPAGAQSPLDLGDTLRPYSASDGRPATQIVAGLPSQRLIQGNVEPERLWIGRSEDWLKVYGAACAKFWQHITNNSEPGTTSPGVIMPQAVIDAIPLNGRIRRCVDTDNAFIDRANTMIDSEAAARSYESAKKDLKAMMGPDDGELYSEILTLKKDKRGAVRMTIHESRERSAA